MVVSAVVYAVSFLLIRLLSRYRELAADRSGALLTGQPSALISALTKVSQGMNRIPTQDLRAAEPLNAFYFAPAMKLNGGREGEPVGDLLHPPVPREAHRAAGEDPAPARPGQPRTRGPAVMGFLDTLLGRTKPVQPKLDDLFGAAVGGGPAAGGDRVQAHRLGLGLLPRRGGQDRSRDIQKEVRELLDMDDGKPGGGLPVEVSKDSYGYTWLVSNHMSDEMDGLVTDLHAVNSALVDAGFGPQLLCTVVAFSRRAAIAGWRSSTCTSAARSTPSPRSAGEQRRDNALELQVKGVLGEDLRIEPDLARWIAVWGAPGL